MSTTKKPKAQTKDLSDENCKEIFSLVIDRFKDINRLGLSLKVTEQWDRVWFAEIFHQPSFTAFDNSPFAPYDKIPMLQFVLDARIGVASRAKIEARIITSGKLEVRLRRHPVTIGAIGFSSDKEIDAMVRDIENRLFKAIDRDKVKTKRESFDRITREANEQAQTAKILFDNGFTGVGSLGAYDQFDRYDSYLGNNRHFLEVQPFGYGEIKLHLSHDVLTSDEIATLALDMRKWLSERLGANKAASASV